MAIPSPIMQKNKKIKKKFILAIVAILLPIMQKKKKIIYFGNCGNPIADNVKKIYIYIYIYFGNCGNPIADNVKKKKKKKKFWQIVAIPLPIMQKKNYEIRE